MNVKWFVIGQEYSTTFRLISTHLYWYNNIFFLFLIVYSKSTYNSTFIDLTFEYHDIVNTIYLSTTSLFEYNTTIIRTIYDCLPFMIRNDWFFLRYHDVLNELGQIHLYDMYSNPFYYYLLTKMILPINSKENRLIFRFAFQEYKCDWIAMEDRNLSYIKRKKCRILLFES